jgi:16S rRNA (cytosine967-C5)-methyltransferase
VWGVGSRREALIQFLRSRDDVWVQDPASSSAVQAAAHLRPRLVVDACAGRGTKTRQLAATFPEAQIIATDIDPARFQTLARIHGDSPQVRVMPLDEVRLRFAARADLVLLDVPCSNSGVLARRPEAKYRAGDAQLRRLGAIQRQIIDDALIFLAPSGQGRGRILYSTCSIDAEENQHAVAWAVEKYGFSVEHDRLTLPAGLPGEGPEWYHDGSYSALLA